MRRLWLSAAVVAVVLTMSAVGSAQQIRGDYVETRSADVYTGACFANAEVGLVGNQAIMAWKVSEGQWEGTTLDGLSVLGVIKAHATLGDPFADPLPARSVLIVDQNASPEQRIALISFARAMAGDLLKNSVRVEVSPISVEIMHDGGHYGRAIVHAGSIAGIETRSIGSKDHLCGNEVTYYPPLAQMSHAMPAVALLDEYTGADLGVSWTLRDKRSAFVGSFSR
jgi:hypothetical protein